MWNQDGLNKPKNPVAPQPNPVTAQPGPSAEPKLAPERRNAAWIGKSVFIKGELISDEDLTIDGRIEGTITLGDNCLTVGVGAAIQANLTAHTLIISGAVTGNVTATDRIEIRDTGSVDGDITTPRLAVKDGAVLRGRIDVAAQTEKSQRFPVAV
jgi:cytoskeletal protein CcmA (bactofilin family)